MFEFNSMIHEERSKRLRRMPKVTGTVLSAGCSGTWYFNWFSECTGHTGKHVGVELYSSRPSDLPVNVEWIANSVSDMRNVPSSTIDLLFSGQNIEHVSPSDMSNFLLEANRVLKQDGVLTIDSPNRLVTQHLGYTQPEHTLELTPDEAVLLVSAAGFEVEELCGIWLVIDPTTSKRLSFFQPVEGELSFEQRTAGAEKNVSHSFIWWLNARKRRPPEALQVKALVTEIFDRGYPGFIQARFRSGVGKLYWTWGSSGVLLNGTEEGFAVFGPYIPLGGGRYRVVFSIFPDQPQSHGSWLSLDVTSAGGTVSHAVRVLAPSDWGIGNTWHSVNIDFELASYATGIEFRVQTRLFKGRVSSAITLLPL